MREANTGKLEERKIGQVGGNMIGMKKVQTGEGRGQTLAAIMKR